MQQCHASLDPAMEDAHSEVGAMRRLAGMDPTHGVPSGETAILKFRHLLEKHALTGHMMNIIDGTHEQRGQLLPPLHHDDPAAFGNKGYVSNIITRQARKAGLLSGVSLIVRRRHPVSETGKRNSPSTRTVLARVEQAFCLVKRGLACEDAHCGSGATHIVSGATRTRLTNIDLARPALTS